jgi:hypothetical protein
MPVKGSDQNEKSFFRRHSAGKDTEALDRRQVYVVQHQQVRVKGSDQDEKSFFSSHSDKDTEALDRRQMYVV